MEAFVPGLPREMNRARNLRALSRRLSAEPRKFDSFEELAQTLQNLTGDPLEADGGNIVHYRGNVKAKLMIVGEGPGEKEDMAKLPFVGRSGKLLDSILRAVSIDPETEVYITNTVKRRPRNNRDPTPEEVRYYFPFLEEEVRLVDPKLIVLAGKIALVNILPDIDKRITKVHGTWHERWGRPVMPVYHPSYLLRNAKWKENSPRAQMWHDMSLVSRRLDKFRETPGAAEA
mmetsp:Transcript_11037/g.33851  ORF Transcript_11037/g.33851 Transcript_11037/m.33851 type:complete len:231 (-) Transcript_11037:978-1670(-)|eukprot:CAMPEP_0198731290 /NCGR_PEP_ID=MMETSP1475-20131203/29197_1 /TAXON_ID= ORGANISM="Unidentified sp., Strain CCMP1999" /NCGR_SAMPLE_ID=MMETSP1475 /ASSEMBLY_ACC=CAM_ASM_001111 /LENGTH=230 /DNA_ID=CAMNT_0044494243 /DNA_START=47 /DNA_END=739 /DNA_ORIENTATION=-